MLTLAFEICLNYIPYSPYCYISVVTVERKTKGLKQRYFQRKTSYFKDTIIAVIILF